MKKSLLLTVYLLFSLSLTAQQIGYRKLWEKMVSTDTVVFEAQNVLPIPKVGYNKNGKVNYDLTYPQCSACPKYVYDSRTFLNDSATSFKRDSMYANIRTPLPYYLNATDGGYAIFLNSGELLKPNKEVITQLDTSIKFYNFFPSLYLNVIANNQFMVGNKTHLFRLDELGKILWKYKYENAEQVQSVKTNLQGTSIHLFNDNNKKFITWVNDKGQKINQIEVPFTVSQIVHIDEQENYLLRSNINDSTYIEEFSKAGILLRRLTVPISSGITENYFIGRKTGKLYRSQSNQAIYIYNDNDWKDVKFMKGVTYHSNIDYSLTPFLEYPNGNFLIGGSFVSPSTNTIFGDSKVYMKDVLVLMEYPNSYFSTPLERFRAYFIDSEGNLINTITESKNDIININASDNGLLTISVFFKKLSFNSPLNITNTIPTQNILKKYNLKGQLEWQLPIDLPVQDTLDTRVLVGVYKTNDGNYILLDQFYRYHYRNLNPFTPTNFKITKSSPYSTPEFISTFLRLTKITPPCYTSLDAKLITSTQTLCPNTTLRLSTNTDTLGTLSYHWQRDGQTISITRKPTFEANIAGNYSVMLKDSICQTSKTSAVVSVQSRPTPQPTFTTTGSTDFCEGTASATLTANITNKEWKYWWLRDGKTISNTFEETLKASIAGTYQLSAQDSVCRNTVLSTPTLIKVRPKPTATITLNNAIGSNTPFSIKLAANVGVGYSYQWYKDNVTIAGATTASYEATESGSYSVEVSNESCSTRSQEVSITIEKPLAIEPSSVAELMIYPNPNTGKFQVSLPDSNTETALKMYDVNGKEVPFMRHGDKIELKEASGIYWLKLQYPHKSHYYKILIQR